MLSPLRNFSPWASAYAPGFLVPGAILEAPGGLMCCAWRFALSEYRPPQPRHEMSVRRAMLIQLGKRIVLTLSMVLIASSLVFVLIHLSGDPLDGFLAPGASPEVRAAASERLGFDEPIASQWLTYLGNTLTGDFGESWRNHQPALSTVLQRLPATLTLALTAILISSIVGIAVGVLSAGADLPALRLAVRSFGLLGQAIPAFWLGTVMIMVFAVHFRWLPPSGNDGFRSLILPAITLSAYPGSMIARMTQTSLIDVRSRPYITTATAKGLPRRTILWRHAVPNALAPTLAVIGLQAGFLAGGAIVVESVFAYPGIGMLAMQAASDRDLPVVQAFVVVTVVLVGMVNAVIDLLSTFIDPTIRNARGTEFARG